MNNAPGWQTMMDKAYDKWGITRKSGKAWSYRQFLNNLDAVERKAVILGNFHCQTCNGGLQQWVDNGYASDSGRDLLEILDEMDTEKSREVVGIVRAVLKHVDLSQGNQGFGADYWLEPWVDDEPPSYMLEVDELTDKYYEFYDSWVPEVEEFLMGLTV